MAITPAAIIIGRLASARPAIIRLISARRAIVRRAIIRLPVDITARRARPMAAGADIIIRHHAIITMVISMQAMFSPASSLPER